MEDKKIIMANGNKVTWKFVIGIAGAVILLLLSAVTSLTFMGVSSIQGNLHELKVEFSKRCEEGEKRDREAEVERTKIKMDIAEMKIFLTMNHTERMQALERLQKMKAKGH